MRGARPWVDAHCALWMDKLRWHSEMRVAAEYVVSGGGKAIRPTLVFWAYSQFSGNSGKPPESVLDLALALEFIHSYSLVHDDLPCMDDDDFRRGRPTLHRVTDEAAAVLAGDALLTGAFEILGKSDLPAATARVALVELSRAAGGAGMVAGQMIDLRLKDRPLDLASLTLNHNLKTGALFGVALAFGLLGANGSLTQLESARAWGVKLGLLFQVVDDLLDANPQAEAKGDEGPNFVNLLGVAETRSFAARLKSELLREAALLGTDPGSTESVLEFFVQRTV